MLRFQILFCEFFPLQLSAISMQVQCSTEVKLLNESVIVRATTQLLIPFAHSFYVVLSGFIKCLFSNVDLEYPAIIAPMDSQKYTVNEDTDITFICTASGSPAPSILFLYDNQSLSHTDRRPKSVGEALMDRVLLENETVTFNASTGLHVVTRTLTLFNSVEGNTGNFTCSASADIPGTGVRSANASFSLLVYRKLLLQCSAFFSFIKCKKLIILESVLEDYFVSFQWQM